MTPLVLTGALVVLLGAYAITMRRADAHRPKHALGAADDLRGWPETLAAIRSDIQTIQAADLATADTAPIELTRWVPPEVVAEWMDPAFLFTHRQEVPRGEA